MNWSRRSGLRFQTVSGSPAAAMRMAMGRPIAPRPRKAVFMQRTEDRRQRTEADVGKIPSHYLSCMVTRVRIEGMSCQHCVRAVFTSLAAVEGIARADVSIGAAEVEHDGRVTVESLREAIEVAGYSVVDGQTNRRRLPLV